MTQKRKGRRRPAEGDVRTLELPREDLRRERVMWLQQRPVSIAAQVTAQK
jgi:hypothetical protein